MALYASKMKFSRRKLNILVKREKIEILNSNIFPILHFHESIKKVISNKQKWGKIALERKKIKPYIENYRFNKQMRKDFFYRLKRDDFKTQFRYGDGNGARDNEFFKLMNDHKMSKFVVKVQELYDNYNKGYLTIFESESNNKNLKKLIKNTDTVKIKIKKIGVEALGYIIENDLVCVAYFDNKYGEYIEGLIVYSKDVMDHETYRMMNY